jgi:hypothetical protein
MRLRSHTSVATGRTVTLVVTMKAAASRNDSSGGARANGPRPRSVPTTARPETIAIPVAASRGPNRNAAHNSTGGTRNASGYVFRVKGTAPPNTTWTTRTTLSSRRSASQGRSPMRPSPRWRSHSSSAGTTTRSPATSPSHHVAQMAP